MTEVARSLDTTMNPPVAVERPLPDNALDLPFEFSFNCHGCRFIAGVEDTPDGAVLSVEGVVATVPFSAGSPAARAMTIAMLANHPSLEIVGLELAGRNRIVLRGQVPLGDHSSRSGTIAVVSAMLSAAKPLIDILKTCGACTVTPPIDFDGAEAIVAVS